MTALALSAARVLLIIGGGVSAYKSLDLIRRLRERGAAVRVVMTAAAKHFVSPLSAAALSGAAVRDDLFSLVEEAEMGHIELSRAADLIVVAPATADLLARMVHGLANDLASTTLLATDKRVLVAPAMNVRMWLHPATQRNVAALAEDGVAFVGPDSGEMACGEFGPGRMAEPLAIVEAVEHALGKLTFIPLPFAGSKGPLSGRHIVVTAGPTFEPIDPVRYIGNRSSGLQGFALAQAALDAGARVTLIRGPVSLADPKGAAIVRVETAQQMLEGARAALPADVFIAAAAVADWRVEKTGDQKVKKGSGITHSLSLVENPDILAEVARAGATRPGLVIGFAAETENLLENARGKLSRKCCDLIVANSVAEGTGVFGGADNQVHILSPSGTELWPRMSKAQIAERLIALIASRIGSSQ
jgi:phosphopantothenoylcysteine decarboxylase / phosphopantothenate---cysteine ligase